MKTMHTIPLILTASTLLVAAGGNDLKRYDVRSAKILYEIQGSGNIMGIAQTRTKGKKRLIFDHYGTKEITETVKVTQESAAGKSNVKKEHTLVYLNGGILYQVDFARKRITRMKNPAQAMGALFGGDKNLMKTGEAMLRKMGGKKVGTDTVLGHTCDLWKAMGTTQCLYHGIPLRIESNIMGIQHTETAIKAVFNLKLSSKTFKLPDFPITDVAGAPLNLDRKHLEQIDEKASRKQQQQLREGAEAMKAAFAAAAAHQGESADAQKAAIANAMLPMMKRKFQKKRNDLARDRACLRRASTLNQARACSRGREMDEEAITQWDAAEKKKILGFIDQGIKAMECATKAKSMQAIERCFPKNRH